MYYELDSEKSLDEKGTRKKEKANAPYYRPSSQEEV